MKKILSILIVLLMLPVMVKAELGYNFENIDVYSGSGYEEITKVKQTSDGGFIVLGMTDSKYFEGSATNGSLDGVIMKFDSRGDLEWKKIWGTEELDALWDVTELEMGGYVVVGETEYRKVIGIDNTTGTANPNAYNSNAIMIKISEDGLLEWETTYGGNHGATFLGVTENDMGNLVYIGYTYSDDLHKIGGHYVGKPNTNGAAIIGEFDEHGILEKSRMYYSDRRTQFDNVLSTNRGGQFVTGFEEEMVTSNHYKVNTITYAFDRTGGERIGKKHEYNETMQLFNVRESSDGYYYGIGFTIATDIPDIELNGGNDSYLIKMDESGETIWNVNWGGSEEDYFNNAIEYNDNIYAVGTTYSTDAQVPNNGRYDGTIAKFTTDGRFVDALSWGGRDDEEFDYIQHYTGDKFFVVGTVASYDIEGVNTNANGDIFVGVMEISDNYNKIYDFDISNEDGNGYAKIERDGNKVYLTIVPYDGYKLKSITGDYGFNERNNFTRLPDGRYYLELTEDLVLTIKFERDYKITLNPVEHGEATAEQYDKTIGRISATPDEGYELDSIVIKDTTDKEIVYTQKEDGYYYFDLNDDVEITVTFKEIPKEVVKGDEEENTDTTTTTTNKVEEEEKVENPKTADAFIYYACAVVCSLFGIWSVEQYRKTVKE